MSEKPQRVRDYATNNSRGFDSHTTLPYRAFSDLYCGRELTKPPPVVSMYLMRYFALEDVFYSPSPLELVSSMVRLRVTFG